MKMPRRRTVLIVGHEKSVLNLRGGGRPNKKKRKTTITSLLYQEFDDKNQLLNEFWMYSLEDVSVFFKQFLETEVCLGTCADSDDEKKPNPVTDGTR